MAQSQVKYIKQYPLCDGRCQYATNDVCQCQCKGRYHGYIYLGHRKNIRKFDQVCSREQTANGIYGTVRVQEVSYSGYQD